MSSNLKKKGKELEEIQKTFERLIALPVPSDSDNEEDTEYIMSVAGLLGNSIEDVISLIESCSGLKEALEPKGDSIEDAIGLIEPVNTPCILQSGNFATSRSMVMKHLRRLLIEQLRSRYFGLRRFVQTAFYHPYCFSEIYNDNKRELARKFLITCLPYMDSKERAVFSHLDIYCYSTIAEQVASIAKLDDTVLIMGETGTGKDLIAKAIHLISERRTAPFVPINCASIPDGLIESELYGHVKGSFTGAIGDRKGYLEAAQGGTVFLDEIGDMPLHLQAKLLRTLNDKEIIRVGGDPSKKPIELDVRIICATNQNLQQQIKNGKFRKDLYYRISTFNINMPSLRSMLSNIKISDPGVTNDPINATLLYLSQEAPYKDETRFYEVKLTTEALQKLLRYQYPGNFRELTNVLKRALSRMQLRKEFDDADLHDDVCADVWYEIDEEMIDFQGDSLGETSNEDELDISRMTYQEVMNYCRRIEIQKMKELLERNRGHAVLRKCAIEMGLVSQNGDEYTKKNRVADLRKKLIEMDIDYKKYERE